MKNIRYVVLIVAFLFQTSLFAQTKIDSLQNTLNSAKHDTTILSTYVELFSAYTFKNMDSTIHYLSLAEELQKKVNLKKVDAKIFKTKGNIAWWKGDLKLARKNYIKSINIWKELNDNKAVARLYFNISLSHNLELDSAFHYLNLSSERSLLGKDSLGYISCKHREAELLTRLSKFEECLIIYDEVLSYAKRNNNTKYKHFSHHGLGLVHFRTGNYKKALEYHLKEFETASLRGFANEKHTACNGLAITYYKLGNTEKSEKFHHKSLEFAREYGNPRTIATSLTNIYEQLVAQERYKEATPYVEEALELAEKHTLKDLFMSLYINSGKSALFNGKYSKAEEHVRKGVSIAHERKSYPWLAYGYEALVKIDSTKGNFERALTYKDSLITFNDSVKSADINEKIEELNVRYKTQQKEQENTTLKQQQISNELEIKNRNIVIIAISIFGALALGLIIVTLVSRRKLRERNIEILNQKDEIQTQSEELSASLEQVTELNKFKGEITQMLVHDLKNPLNTLINLPEKITSEEKTEIRKSSSRSMLNLVLNILDVRKYKEADLILNKKEINISEVWESVIQYQLYNLNQKNIKFSSKVNKSIMSSVDSELLERVFTNLLSNAIKYTPPHGSIKFSAEGVANGAVKIEISDTGQGVPENEMSTIFDKYKQAGSKIKYSTGLGLTFCKIVVEKHGGEIQMESNNNKGTTVWFTIPSAKILVNNVNVQVIDKNKKIALTENQKEELKESVALLNQIDISEISAFRKIFKTIETSSLGNKEWRESLRNSVYSSDEELFIELLKLTK